MLKLISQHENSKKSHSITKESLKFTQELNFVLDCHLPAPNENVCKTREMSKNKGLKQIEDRWQNKPLYGQYTARLQNTEVDVEVTLQWLSSSELKAETERFIFAAQDQSLFTRNYQVNIIRNGTDPKCRFCGERVETIDHLISGCSVLTPGKYKRRHDRIGQYLHWKICNHFKVSTKKNKYKDLEIEIGKMWHLRARTIRVVIGALSLVKKGTEDFLDKIPGKPSLRNPEDSSERHSPCPQKSSNNITSNFTHLRSLVVTRCLIL